MTLYQLEVDTLCIEFDLPEDKISVTDTSTTVTKILLF